MGEKSTYLEEPEHVIFCKNIRKYRKKIGKSQVEIAKLLKTSNKYVSRWEKGLVLPGFDQMLGLCEIYKISLDELCRGTSVYGSITSEEINFLNDLRKLDKRGQAVVTTFIHSMSAVKARSKKKCNDNILDLHQYLMPASAGGGSIISESDDYESVRVYKRDDIADVDMLIKISGDSMSPTFKSGQSVFVKKTSDISVGEIGVFIVNGESFIKEKGKGCLISHNKKYNKILIKKNDNVNVIGKVVGILKKDDIVANK